MSFLIFLCLLAFPIIEIVLFTYIGGFIGGWGVFWFCVLGMLLGAFILRYELQGLAMGMLRAEDDNLFFAITHNILKLVGAVFLIMPGFLTDFIALLLFVSWVRVLLIETAVAHLFVRLLTPIFGGFSDGDWVQKATKSGDDIIEGEYRVEKPSNSSYIDDERDEL